MKKISLDDFRKIAHGLRRPFHSRYYAMYSSVLGGIVTDPALMTLPADDHMAHRGDGVFETMKCIHGSIYNMKAHIDRLLSSADALGLRLPCPTDELMDIIVETARAGGRPDTCLRVYISRGPGSFGVNPYDCPRCEVYAVATWLPLPFMATHPQGARVKTSTVPCKEPFFARVKSCNYLHNVLMARECADAGFDFAMAFDSNGFLAEGAAENMGIVTAGRELLFPRPGKILPGTTMLRAIDLAKSLAAEGAVARIGHDDIPRQRILNASEGLIVGTTLDIVAVREFDGHPIGTGTPGPVYRELSRLLQEDMRRNSQILTPVF